LHVFIKDWADDPFTSTSEDETGSGPIEAGCGDWFDSGWRHVISLTGSEFSQTEPGFLSGAVASSLHAVTALLSKGESGKKR